MTNIPFFTFCSYLLLYPPENTRKLPQNGQTHSNNSSAVADEFFECIRMNSDEFECIRMNSLTFLWGFLVFSGGYKMGVLARNGLIFFSKVSYLKYWWVLYITWNTLKLVGNVSDSTQKKLVTKRSKIVCITLIFDRILKPVSPVCEDLRQMIRWGN